MFQDIDPSEVAFSLDGPMTDGSKSDFFRKARALRAAMKQHLEVDGWWNYRAAPLLDSALVDRQYQSRGIRVIAQYCPATKTRPEGFWMRADTLGKRL